MLVIYFIALFAVGVLTFVGGALVWMYAEARELREPRTILCPETLLPAEVNVDGSHAARTALAGREELRLRACSRWPERRDCDQACVLQVPLVGDSRRRTRYAAFGVQPQHLRSNSPVAMSAALYARIAPRADQSAAGFAR